MARKRKGSSRKGRETISSIETFANWCIWSVTFLIAFVFAGITLKDIPVGQAISNTNPDYVQAIILSFYIFCWAAGTTIDTKFQSAIYLVDPRGGRVRMGAIFAVAALTAISIIVLRYRSNELYFSLALAAFTTIDILTWLYLRYKFLPPIVEASQNKYEQERDYYGLAILNVVISQITGNWKWWRQVLMSAIILTMILIALSPQSKDIISELIASAIRVADADSIRPLLPTFLLLAFVLVSEIWHFFFRLETYLEIHIIRSLEIEYKISPRTTS